MAFSVRFWGVRGSIACPGPRHIAFGGNTACVELRLGETRVILDSGTGIRNLGRRFLEDDVRHAFLLLSHTHWDHINGFPFFRPAYQPARHFTIMGGHLAQSGGVRTVLSDQMAHPTFPVPLDIMKAHLDFEDFNAGERFKLNPDIEVSTARLNHPNGATGYRIAYGGKSMCYVTDTEHHPGKPDERILGLIEGADLVIYDSTYTDEEFPEELSWGHSTWQEGIRLCRQAGAKALAIFHHDPDHEDTQMERIESAARKEWQGAMVARENGRFELL